MSSEVLRGIDPRGYFAAFFKEGIYPDGRGVLDEPKLVFKQGECGGVGSAVVSTQGVTVSCSIEASVSLASDGELVDVKIEPSQQLSEKDADDYNALLLSLFTNQFFIKRENLKCLNSDGKQLPLEWQLHVSVKVLSLDGSLFDSVVVAVSAALADVKLPSIVLNHASEDESAIEKSQILVDPRTSHRLNLEEPLICCSFGIFSDFEDVKSSEVLLVAPSTEVVSICRATCSVIVGKDDQMVLVRQRGRMSKFSMLRKISEIAAQRRRKFVESLKISS